MDESQAMKAILILVSIFLSTILPSYAQEDSICGFFYDIPVVIWPPEGVPGPDDFDGTNWAQRPLIPAPHDDDICMGDFVTANSPRIQNIYMKEEIPHKVIIAQLNYEGDDPKAVMTFLTGSSVMLQAQVERMPEHDNKWFITVSGRQDYESLPMNNKDYLFTVQIESEPTQVYVHLHIINIDDNAPIIHVFDDCEVKEMGEPRLTDCVYEVTDADGEISTRFMTFEINSDRGDDEIFDIHPERDLENFFRMTMTLELKQPLDYILSAFRIFSVTAKDSLPNNHTAALMVEVINIEYRLPRWVEIWAVQQFDEKTEQTFSVQAIDGDTGIDQAIYYRLTYPETDEELPYDPDDYFSIETLDEGRGGGLFHVKPIDRDELQIELFQLNIVAYKEYNESSFIETLIAIIIQDVNDQFPEPFFDIYEISIREETPMTLAFDKEFGFHDRDLGQNAQYSIRLESVEPEGAAEAFYVAPQSGYQRQTFIMGTVNHSMLDYEVPEFQHIILKVIATEEFTEEKRVGEALIHINLINWNDEEPIFAENVLEVQFDETVKMGYHVATIHADDRDIDDWVTHSLLGNAVNYLTINEDTGEITVAIEDAFNYHRQNELYVQVQAQDNFLDPALHTSTSQLIIRLNDINNTPPSLRLPRRSPEVEENVPEGFLITDEITATDPDTTSDLEFFIVWETSYATKQGRLTPSEEYEGCVTIRTIPHETDPRSVYGELEVQTIREGVTIDFEEFEILYLTVRVVDHETVIGDDYDELTLAVIIIDMNDNWPIWDEDTLQTQFRVRERSLSGVVIGSVLANDIDGPLYNQIRYSIIPREDTPPNLVRIDPINGQLSVDADDSIDADVPPRHFLYYTVVASDECTEQNPEDCPPDPIFWETEGQITIEILDINNKIPVPDKPNYVVHIYENATTGHEVVQVIATDLDRDVYHHTLNYQINYLVNPSLQNFFAIDPATGEITVHYTDTGIVLDRDRGEPEHQMFITIIDNFNFDGDGSRNQAGTEVLVVLCDVNDNAPELPTRDELGWDVSENEDEGHRLDPDIYAPDIDEPDTDNSRVGYEILSLTPMDRDITPPQLFIMINIDNVTGELETAMPLRGYWGTYDIEIRAYDHGVPQQMLEETYELVVMPYNYHAPEFVFPVHGTVVRLARERAAMNVPLILPNGETLDRIEATDEDGLHAGIVDFTINGDDNSIDHFTVSEDGILLLTRTLAEHTEFQVTIRATDRGTDPGPLFTDTIISVVFVPIQADPVFNTNTATVAIMEFEGGLEERHELPPATDAKNYKCTDDCHTVYYHIIDGNENGHFALEPLTNILYLESELNRIDAEQHTIIVAATNSATPPAGQPNSVLTVTVNVRESNPRPRFLQALYTAGISAGDNINNLLFTVRAIHTENVPITYSIDFNSMEVDHPSLQNVAATAFRMDENTGQLYLNMQPSSIMHGMFKFVLIADDGTATDEADAMVFLISSQNRVTFIFVNSLEQIQDSTDFIAQTFTVGFKMICNLDDVIPASDSDGTALLDRTEVRAHFIRDYVPVPAEEIEELRSDIQLLQSIQTTLSTQLINMDDFVTNLSPDVGFDYIMIMLYILGALSALFAITTIILLVVYCIKTRSLNRRLQSLSITKFGSMESNLNRAGISGIAYPGTNKHAIEGSNPVWNEEMKAPNFDALSEFSGDSDLIGIEDMPQFLYGNMPEENRDSITASQSGIASHNNNFGFPKTPFSQMPHGRQLDNYESHDI